MIFIGLGSIIINEINEGIIGHTGVSIVFAVIVMFVVYMISSFSGAHINPAVSIAFACIGYISLRDLAPYMISQILGSIFACFILLLIFPNSIGLGITIPLNGDYFECFIIEAILTFILMFVILNVSFMSSPRKKILAPIAIGLVVGIGSFFFGSITGASMNPARTLGPALMAASFDYLWIYILAPISGSCLSIVAYKNICSKC